MGGPVQIPFNSFIHLRQGDATALYLQIVFEFIKAIQMGLLPEGTKLPGTRDLCRVLSVNRNTLIKAFQDLEAQGFIEILPNKGTFILSGQQGANRTRVKGDSVGDVLSPVFDFRKSTVLDDPAEISSLPYQFNDGLPDPRLLHTDLLARLYVSKLKQRRSSKTWEQVQADSHRDFIQQFTNFLNLTRGLRINSSQLLTTSSHEICLYLVCKVLITAGDNVVVASPGYYLSNMSLSDSGARILSVPMDESGIDIAALSELCSRETIRMLYLTSSYHYPTTTAITARRRMEILELAHVHGFIIVEDDYDFDYHYDNNPMLPLAALDGNPSVIYIGSFARSLPVGFGYGFVAAAAPFISELKKHQRILEPGIDLLKEQALTDWIKEGDAHRLVKKNRKLYKERRDHFVELLRKKLNGRVKFNVPARGLAIWVEWLDEFNLMQLRKGCASRGLLLPTTILYQNKQLIATRLGFGHFNHEELSQVVSILSQALIPLVKENQENSEA